MKRGGFSVNILLVALHTFRIILQLSIITIKSWRLTEKRKEKSNRRSTSVGKQTGTILSLVQYNSDTASFTIHGSWV